ncbi:SIR2 family protein [Helicobacter pylori]
MNHQQYKEFIETSIDNIRKAHNENYLSIFAGAGISAESKLPKWGDLINELQKCLYGDTKKNEDYLVLAEKFYNQFGESFYYQTLKSLIPNNAKPNDLHLGIVKLNIKNLITTNWDNLFEQAINEEGIFFNIIKSDKDIGSSTGFAKFIKMHGSLDENNIVFKEQDYLEYSNNFPLIENYIKGVFSTDTVILLGYSLSDQNVKQIISWVNSHSKSVKPIYFIKTAKEFDRIEFEFYKNKNIHILYTQEYFGKQGHYEELLSFLKEIKKDKPKDISKSYSGIISSTKQLRKMIFNFDYNAMKKRISEIISLKSSSVLNELEKAFLLYHLGQGIQSFETLKINSKQAFRERNYDVWYISLYNMYNIPLFYGYSDENNLRNSYDSMGYFITKQWNKFKIELKAEIKFSILDRILFSFIRKLTENFSGYLMILESSPRCMQNLLFILQQYNIEYNNIDLDLMQQALINTLIKEIMELPNDTQIFISNYLICDLFPITKNNDGVNQNVKNFLLNIWEKNQNRKTIQEDKYYLLLTSNMHRIGILNSEQYQKIFLELKNKYMDRETAKKFNNEQPIHEQLLKQAMQEDALDRMLALLKDCENGFKKE